jgi:hypothetical protein
VVTLTVPLEWQPLKRGVKKSIHLQLNFEIMSSRKIILKYFGICHMLNHFQLKILFSKKNWNLLISSF